MINLRGVIIPIMDLRIRFDLRTAAGDARKLRMIVTRCALQAPAGALPGLLGIVVDSVEEVIHVPKKDIDAAPAVAKGRHAEFIAGMAKVGERLIIVLDITRVLNLEERRALAEAGNV